MFPERAIERVLILTHVVVVVVVVVCRRRRQRRHRLRRRLLSRRSLRPPVPKQKVQTDNSRNSVLFAKTAVLGWAGGGTQRVNNLEKEV